MTTVLRGITWEHSRGYDCMVASAARYAQLVPDVEVRWEFRSLQAFADAPIDALAADYDLLVIDHPHIPLAAEEGLFARLDGVGFDDQLETLATQSVGRSHESYAHNGHQYGLASDAAAQVAVYRPDLIAEPPRDWAAVLELARDGLVLWPAKPIDAYSSLVTIAGVHGHGANAEPGVFLPADAAEQALGIMHELAALVPPSNLAFNPIQVAEALSTENRWAYAPLAFGYTNYSRPGFRPGRLAYTDIPAGPAGVSGSLLGGAGIAVSARSAELDAARAFAFWVSSAEVQKTVYYDGGGQPGNAVAWEDDRLNDDTLGFFRNTRATLEGAYLRPRLAGYIEFQDLVSPWVTEALRGELSDAELITRLNDAAARLLTGE
ncbi:extracellular solute-binding protein [Compostimonas suwonensis]|uniref:Multiple sugar transport system substrate-binding protein n=1 Tax=Compostimonas suwonensis TaxID=1048394 RepID=A0A2M9C4D3_9MICO|nr:extracellular solute-binding protein [Compostimonas suwonensis]PJJ65372.1 multiple sugar transport system substrate-binding protein [Compostimonas suwonensis]